LRRFLDGADGDAPAAAAGPGRVSPRERVHARNPEYDAGQFDQPHSNRLAGLGELGIQRASGAQTIVDLHPAIPLAVRLVDDHLSVYEAAAGADVANPRLPGCATVTPAPASVPADIGYVKVPVFSDATPGADRAFADSIQQQIRRADAVNLAGWIVDVRGNG